jgi:hypothetical protein
MWTEWKRELDLQTEAESPQRHGTQRLHGNNQGSNSATAVLICAHLTSASKSGRSQAIYRLLAVSSVGGHGDDDDDDFV